MKDHIQLVDKPKALQLYAKDFLNLKSEEDKIAYVSQNTTIEISPMRIENIMLYLVFPAKLGNLPDLQLHFSDDSALRGSNSNRKYYLKNLTAQYCNDKKMKWIRIVDTGKWSLTDLFEVKHIGFSFVDKIPNQDVEFKIDVYNKWTYMVCADGINNEFWYLDGKRYHQIGDNFSYPLNKKVELSVREQNEKFAILYCSAMGKI